MPPEASRGQSFSVRAGVARGGRPGRVLPAGPGGPSAAGRRFVGRATPCPPAGPPATGRPIRARRWLLVPSRLVTRLIGPLGPVDNVCMKRSRRRPYTIRRLACQTTRRRLIWAENCLRPHPGDFYRPLSDHDFASSGRGGPQPWAPHDPQPPRRRTRVIHNPVHNAVANSLEQAGCPN